MITVVAEPDNVPPRNVITVSVSDPVVSTEIIQSITVNRVVSGVRTPLRQQPVPGSSEIVAFDYEAPYGVSVSYEWEGSWADSGALIEVFSEDWSDVSAWSASGDPGISFGVSGGVLQATNTAGSFQLARLTHLLGSTGSYRVVVADPPIAPPSVLMELDFLPVPDGFSSISSSEGGSSILSWGDHSVTFDPGTGSWTVDMLDQLILLTTTAGTYSIASAGIQIEGIQFPVSSSASGTYPVAGAITVYSYGDAADASEESDSLTLSPTNGWLIHPSFVNRSVELGAAADSIGVAAIAELTNPAKATTHDVIGRPDPIVVAAGPRASDRFTLSLITDSIEHRDAVRTLVQDQTPILINIDPAFGYDLAYGFYSVGDISTARLVQLAGEFHRTIVLPLTSVRSPSVSIAEVGWSFASVASEFPSFASVAAGFASFNDLLLNVRA